MIKILLICVFIYWIAGLLLTVHHVLSLKDNVSILYLLISIIIAPVTFIMYLLRGDKND